MSKKIFIKAKIYKGHNHARVEVETDNCIIDLGLFYKEHIEQLKKDFAEMAKEINEIELK